MLKKIIKIKNFGCFKDFKANDKLKEFKKYNLLWGLNGTGKTTLSNLFRCLNEGCIPEDIDKNSFKENFDILLEDNQHITNFENNSFFNRIKIFDRDFVDKNLTLDNQSAKTNTITYTIGETSKDIKNRISELNFELTSFYEEVNGKKELIVENNYNNINKELDDLYKDVADKIRLDLQIKNAPEYNIRHFKKDYQKLFNSKVLITEEYKNESVNKYIQPIKNKLEVINFKIITNEQILEIKDILSNKIKRADIKEELVQWLEKGLDYKTGDTCPFCKKPLYSFEERYNEIQNIIKKDDSYIEYEKNIKRIFDEINSLYISIKHVYFSLRLDDFSCNIDQSDIEDYKYMYENYKKYIEDVIKSLQLKINNPDKTYCLDDNKIIIDYIKSREKINQLIIEHNFNVDNIIDIKNKAKNNVIAYYVQQEKESIEYYKKRLENYFEQVNNVKDKIIDIKNEISNLNAELKNQKIPIKELEKYLYIVFGHKKFSLEYDEISNSYNIYRETGEMAKNLSEGEKTVISFAYFLATLKSYNFNMKKAIIVIDDPVSSLDQQYLFNLINLLYEKFKDKDSFEQIFILTHNFYFFKKIRNILLYKKDFFELFQINKKDTSYIDNADEYLRKYTSEYVHIIKYLKNVLNMPENEIKEIPIGNSIRKILEIFLAFRIPSKKNITQRYDVITSRFTEEERCRYMYLNDIANASSHTEESEDIDSLEEFKLFVTKNEIEQLFNFIKLIDKEHYDEVMKI